MSRHRAVAERTDNGPAVLLVMTTAAAASLGWVWFFLTA